MTQAAADPENAIILCLKDASYSPGHLLQAFRIALAQHTSVFISYPDFMLSDIRLTSQRQKQWLWKLCCPRYGVSPISNDRIFLGVFASFNDYFPRPYAAQTDEIHGSITEEYWKPHNAMVKVRALRARFSG